MKPHLYINSKGYPVTRHSYSGSSSFNDCARKYYLERVQGWAEREQRAAAQFGIAIEKAITYWHQRRQDTDGALELFRKLWSEHKDAPLKYSKADGDWDKLNLSGQELVKLYTIRYPHYPFVVVNPLDAFQVQTNFEVFPYTDLAGIEFTSYIDLMAQLKGAPARQIIIDIKTSGKDVPEFTVLDPQLRSYSWVKGMPDVGFLWFRKMGRTFAKGDSATFLEALAGFEPGADVIVLAHDDFGIWVTGDFQVVEEAAKFKGESEAVVAARAAWLEANAKNVPEKVLTKQRVQFKHAFISSESAQDMGRKIKQDIVSIAAANESGEWHMNSGVRFPQERCPMCPMRGICADRPELRDELLVRKQMEELDFNIESE